MITKLSGTINLICDSHVLNFFLFLQVLNVPSLPDPATVTLHELQVNLPLVPLHPETVTVTLHELQVALPLHPHPTN